MQRNCRTKSKKKEEHIQISFLARRIRALRAQTSDKEF